MVELPARESLDDILDFRHRLVVDALDRFDAVRAPLDRFECVEIGISVGNSQMYQLNRDDPAAENLARLEWTLLDCISEWDVKTG